MKNEYNNKWTIDEIKKTLKVLKNNEIYRLGDGLKFKKSHKLVKYILSNNKYDNTILKLYHQQNNNNSNNNLNNIIKNKMKEYHINSDENILFVHVRQGDDYSRRCLGNTSNFTYFLQNINNSKCNKVVIVTALHYGTSSEKNSLYSSDKYNYTDINYNKNISKFHELIENIEKPVDIISNDDVDLDFIYLVTAKNLLICPKSGSFSNLAKKYNEIYKNNKL